MDGALQVNKHMWGWTERHSKGYWVTAGKTAYTFEQDRRADRQADRQLQARQAANRQPANKQADSQGRTDRHADSQNRQRKWHIHKENVNLKKVRQTDMLTDELGRQTCQR